jgi:hypothetical protein
MPNNMGYPHRGEAQELPAFTVDVAFRRIALPVIFVNHGKVSLLPLARNIVFAVAAKLPGLST